MSLFVSLRAQRALATVNAPSHLEKGHESQAQLGPFPCGAPFRAGKRLEDGPPPPGTLLGRISKRKKEEAQGRETKKTYKRPKTRLKDSANAEPNPITSYTPDNKQYVKRLLKTPIESFVQHMYFSYRRHEYDSSASYLPDTNDSRGKVGLSSDSAPPLERGGTLTTPSASVSTQNRPKHVVGVPSINNDTSTTNPLLQPPSLLSDSQTLAGKSSVVSHHVQTDC